MTRRKHARRAWYRAVPEPVWWFAGSLLSVVALALFRDHPGPIWLRGISRPLYEVFFSLAQAGVLGTERLHGWKRWPKLSMWVFAASVIAVLAALALYFAVPRPGTDVRQFTGLRLGHLRELVNEAYADGKTDERILFEPAAASILEDFQPAVSVVRRRTWLDVAVTICETSPCLSCDVDRKRRVVTIGLRSEPIPCTPHSGNPFYVCPSQACD